jgi:hypothetical protein
VVAYGKASDFFYSGHVGIAILSAFEWRDLGFKRMTTFCIFNAIYMAFVVLAFRVHYTCDVFTGAIMGHYSYYVGGLVCPPIDRFMRL